MKVHSLKAEKIRKLQAIAVNLDGENLKVAGKTGQGKTTYCDLVWMALSSKYGGSAPVTLGEKSGSIEVELDGGKLFVRREFGEKSKLIVKSADGKKMGATDIEKMISAISYDPMEFYRLKGLQRKNHLLKMLGIDLDLINAERATCFTLRTDAGRRLRAAQEAVKDAPKYVEKVDLTELLEQYTESTEYNRSIASTKERLEALENELSALLEKVEQLRERIAKGRSILLNLGEPIDTIALEEQISNAQQINAQAHEWTAFTVKKDALQAIEDEYQRIDGNIKHLDERKEVMLSSAKWPLPNMGMNEDGDIVLDGVPIEQLGESMMLRVSFAIAMKEISESQIRICRIDGAESLGAEGRKEIERLATENDIQLFMSRVSDGGAEDGEIIIEDGKPVNE